jgi:hypothetical protein
MLCNVQVKRRDKGAPFISKQRIQLGRRRLVDIRRRNLLCRCSDLDAAGVSAAFRLRVQSDHNAAQTRQPLYCRCHVSDDATQLAACEGGDEVDGLEEDLG